MNLFFKKLTTKEVNQIHQIVITALKEDMPYSQEIIDAYIDLFTEKYFHEFIKKKGNVILGAIVESNLAGLISLQGDIGGVSYVERIAVKKEFRKKGIGTKLLTEAEKWLLANNFHYLFLHTYSQKNIVYYKNHGFGLVGMQRKAWFGANEYLLEKILRDKPFAEIFKKSIK